MTDKKPLICHKCKREIHVLESGILHIDSYGYDSNGEYIHNGTCCDYGCKGDKNG